MLITQGGTNFTLNSHLKKAPLRLKKGCGCMPQSRYAINRCKESVGDTDRKGKPYAECRNPKAWYKQEFSAGLLTGRR